MRHHQRVALVCFVLLVAAIAGQVAMRMLVSPDVQFLVPRSGGAWIVHPDPLPGYQRATFTNRVELSEVPRPCPVAIVAMRTGDVTVNGQPLAKAAAANWKEAVEYDFAPLLREGANEIRIAITNSESPPAVLVAGPEKIRSGVHWVVDQAPENAAEVPAAIAHHGEVFVQSKPNLLGTSPHYDRWWWALAAYLAFLAYAVVPVRFKPWLARREPGTAAGATKSWWPALAALVLVAVVATIHVHNATRYPTEGGFDSKQHAEYVHFLAERREVPDASNGWEMSQPPLYYALAAVIYEALGRSAEALRRIQLFTALTTLAVLLPAWWILGVVFPGNARARVSGLLVAASLPMMFYVAPQVTNEPMAALTIGTTIALAVRHAARERTSWGDAILLGIACGLSLLSKYTGAFVTASIVALALLRVLTGAARVDRDRPPSPVGRRLVHFGWGAVVVAIALGMSGWLYAHNIRKFGTPFMGAWDVRSGFRIVQPPGYRTPEFYTRFGGVFWEEPPHTRATSFWDGMYGSMWSDSHGVFVSRDATELQWLSSIILWLAMLPTVAIATGLFAAIRHLVRVEWDHPYFVPVVTTILTVSSTLVFTIEHAWYSNLKSHWALSLVPCAALFGALGLEILYRQLGRLRYLAYANLAAVAALVFYVFWYRGA